MAAADDYQNHNNLHPSASKIINTNKNNLEPSLMAFLSILKGKDDQSASNANNQLKLLNKLKNNKKNNGRGTAQKVVKSAARPENHSGS